MKREIKNALFIPLIEVFAAGVLIMGALFLNSVFIALLGALLIGIAASSVNDFAEIISENLKDEPDE